MAAASKYGGRSLACGLAQQHIFLADVLPYGWLSLFLLLSHEVESMSVYSYVRFGFFRWSGC